MPLPTAVTETGREVTLFHLNFNTVADITERYLKGEQTVSDKQALIDAANFLSSTVSLLTAGGVPGMDQVSVPAGMGGLLAGGFTFADSVDSPLNYPVFPNVAQRGRLGKRVSGAPSQRDNHGQIRGVILIRQPNGQDEQVHLADTGKNQPRARKSALLFAD